MKHNAILQYPTFTRKGKVLKLSMNVFKRMHWGSQNKCKQDYHDLVEGFVDSLPKFKWLKPSYTLYFEGNRVKDLDNYWFPCHKFLMDALVEKGKIQDDNYKYVKGFDVEFGDAGKDVEDYYVVELTGEELDEKDEHNGSN